MRVEDLAKPSDSKLEELLAELERLNSRSNFLLRLSLDERIAFPKLDEDREAFTQRALRLGEERPELLPPGSDVEVLKEGIELRDKLRDLFEASNRLTERLDDTIIACGSEAYLTALAVYKAVEVKSDEDPTLRKEREGLQRLFEPWEHIGR